MPSVAPTQTRMTQNNGSLQEAPRSLWGRLPIKAGLLGQTEERPRGCEVLDVGGGQHPTALVY